jgi:hypothetical protein
MNGCMQLAGNDMTYTLKLDQAALQLVGVALGKMPHEQVAALIAAIQQQINAQEHAARGAQAGDAAPLAAGPTATGKPRARKRTSASSCV